MVRRYINLIRAFYKAKKYYLCGVSPMIQQWRITGEMAERSNAAVLKTVVLHPRNRGFESLFLRQINSILRHSRGIFVFRNIQTWSRQKLKKGRDTSLLRDDINNKLNLAFHSLILEKNALSFQMDTSFYGVI